MRGMLFESFQHVIDSLDCQIVAMSVSNDDKVLATGDQGGMVHLYDVATKSLICSIKSVGTHLLDVHMEDSQSVVFGFEDHLSIFNKEGKPIKDYDFAPEKHGKIVSIRKRENLIFITTRFGLFLVYDILADSTTKTLTIQELPAEVDLNAVFFNTDFTRGVAGSTTGEIFSLEVNSGS